MYHEERSSQGSSDHKLEKVHRCERLYRMNVMRGSESDSTIRRKPKDPPLKKQQKEHFRVKGNRSFRTYLDLPDTCTAQEAIIREKRLRWSMVSISAPNLQNGAFLANYDFDQHQGCLT